MKLFSCVSLLFRALCSLALILALSIMGGASVSFAQEDDPAMASTADYEMPDSQGAAINEKALDQKHQEKIVKTAPSSKTTPAGSAASLMEASLSAAGVRPDPALTPRPLTPQATPAPTAHTPRLPAPRPVVVFSAPRKVVTPAKPLAKNTQKAASEAAPKNLVEVFQPDAVLKSKDTIRLKLYTQTDAPEFDKTLTLGADGMVTCPFIGPVKLVGLSLGHALQTLTSLYADGYYVNPRLSLSLMELQEKGVSP